MNNRKKVIFIYEGVKAEEKLLNNMNKIFFSSKTNISILNCPADGNIYMLWTRLDKHLTEFLEKKYALYQLQHGR